ncbi:MAG: ABC transporter substrate-binding protein [Firmicutes bacterium]|nr:ABC transporter substrate-binding protein [Bacillota bacterium]
MKKLFVMILTIAMLGTFAACGNNDTPTNPNTEYIYNVGLLQLVEHPSLDEIRNAIESEIDSAGYGDIINIDFVSGQNDTSTMNTIAQKFVANEDDAIIAIATPAAQSVAAATSEIPIIFSAITDPVAAELVSNLDAPDGNVTGVSDYIDVAAIFNLANELTPEVKSYGFIYNMGEVNSVSVIEDAKAYLDAQGIPYTEAFVTNIGEVTTAAQSLVGKVDAFFLPIDNTVASAMSNVADIAIKNNIPVYVAADSMVHDGGLATAGVNYTQLGKQTAQMLIRILINGEAIADNPVEVLTEYSVTVNEETAAALGVDVSAYTAE